jgi:hypothetical protein
MKLFPLNTILKLIICLFIAQLCQIPAAFAASEGDTYTVVLGDTSYTCGYINGAWQTGSINKRSKKFETTKVIIANLRKKLKKSRPAGVVKIKASIRKLKSDAKIYRAECEKGDSSAPSPTPTNKITPTPNPTLTQSVPEKFFDGNGNLTNFGKESLGVPLNLPANSVTGGEIYKVSCQGCHGEKSNRTFQVLRTQTAIAPMFFNSTTLPDATLAHITAFLNRFR